MFLKCLINVRHNMYIYKYLPMKLHILCSILFYILFLFFFIFSNKCVFILSAKKFSLLVSQECIYGQGANFKNNKTTKQAFQFIWTNRNVELKLYLLPIGRNKFV